jgi:hypothetical protein
MAVTAFTWGADAELRLLDPAQPDIPTKLPIQFGSDAEDITTIAENGAHGDGTTRMFVENLEHALDDRTNGALAECPNAREDGLIEAAFQRTGRQAAWRALDPRDPAQMAGLAPELGLDANASPGWMQGILRLFYGFESFGAERFELYSLHQETRAIDAPLWASMAR